MNWFALTINVTSESALDTLTSKDLRSWVTLCVIQVNSETAGACHSTLGEVDDFSKGMRFMF